MRLLYSVLLYKIHVLLECVLYQLCSNGVNMHLSCFGCFIRTLIQCSLFPSFLLQQFSVSIDFPCQPLWVDWFEDSIFLFRKGSVNDCIIAGFWSDSVSLIEWFVLNAVFCWFSCFWPQGTCPVKTSDTPHSISHILALRMSCQRICECHLVFLYLFFLMEGLNPPFHSSLQLIHSAYLQLPSKCGAHLHHKLWIYHSRIWSENLG